MCGMAQFIGDLRPALLDRMHDRIAHWGPDDFGTHLLPERTDQRIHRILAKCSTSLNSGEYCDEEQILSKLTGQSMRILYAKSFDRDIDSIGNNAEMKRRLLEVIGKLKEVEVLTNVPGIKRIEG